MSITHLIPWIKNTDNAKNPKRLAEWGFEVDNTTKKP